MNGRVPSDELEEVVVSSSRPFSHRRGFSDGRSKSPGRRRSRSSKEDDSVDDRPLLEHAISEPPTRTQVIENEVSCRVVMYANGFCLQSRFCLRDLQLTSIPYTTV